MFILKVRGYVGSGYGVGLRQVVRGVLQHHNYAFASIKSQALMVWAATMVEMETAHCLVHNEEPVGKDMQ